MHADDIGLKCAVGGRAQTKVGSFYHPLRCHVSWSGLDAKFAAARNRAVGDSSLEQTGVLR
jgi:hypothetical protein